MKRLQVMLLGCALLVLQACAVRPELADLKTIGNSADTAVVAADYAYSYRNNVGETVHVHLMAGTYRLKRANTIGRFFESDRASVWSRVEDRRAVLLFVGGIWVPTDPAIAPRIYHLWSPMFVGSTYEEASKKQQKLLPPPSAGANDAVVNAVLYSPARLSPAQAGLAGAAAAVVVAAITGGDGPRINITPFGPEPQGSQDAERLRAALRFERGEDTIR